MKGRLIAGVMALGALMAVVPVAEAAVPAAKPSNAIVQYHQPQQEWRRNRQRRVVTQTRIVRVGFRRYRETYRTVYLPNGRVRTTVVSRVRI